MLLLIFDDVDMVVHTNVVHEDNIGREFTEFFVEPNGLISPAGDERKFA